MPFKRSQSQYNGLNFWLCICSGVIKLIRQALNGAAVISDHGVPCGGWNNLEGLRYFIPPNLGQWRHNCASVIHAFGHMQIVTVESVLHGAEMCNICRFFCS